MQRKKVLFVITKSNFGGAQRYVFELATTLPKDQYDTVVAFGGNGFLKEKLEAAGIRTRTILSMERDISILKEFRSFTELMGIIREERPDILHLNSPKALGLGALAGRLLSVPRIVSTVHGWPFLEPRSRIWKYLAHIASWVSALLAHRIILVSQNDAAQSMPFMRHKYATIHTSVPLIHFRARDEARNALFSEETVRNHVQDIWLTTYAELNANKNLFTPIDAVGEFNRRNDWKVFYTIIGNGELNAQLAEHIELQGLRDSVTLCGYVSDARTYLPAFDIFLLPSHKEGLPYALLEAGAAGLPSIASRVGGIPEVITDNVEGLLIDPNNPESITRALERFVLDPSLRTKCSTALKTKVATSFSLSSMVAQTEAVYAADAPPPLHFS